MLRIFPNQLDASEVVERKYTCLLTEWLAIREQYPTARLYKDVICVQNDITPKTREQAWALREAKGLYQVVCHAQAPAVIGIVAAVLSVATAVYTYLNMPESPKDPQGVSGSPNNSLAQRQNKHRVGGRVPDNYGKIKALPDLISPVYRYYRDNVQVEECLLCLGTGYYEFDVTKIQEAETPIVTIEGASISIYEPGQSLVTSTPQLSIGEYFGDVPLVTKQVSAIDGKQNLRPPNNKYIEVKGAKFVINGFDMSGVNRTESKYLFEDGTWISNSFNSKLDLTKDFKTGEKITISGAVVPADGDLYLSGNADVDPSGQITIYSSVSTGNISQYTRLNISSLFVKNTSSKTLSINNADKTTTDYQVVTDVDLIDLAGNYEVASISQNDGKITVKLKNPFSTLKNPASTRIFSTLTNGNDAFSLDGTYTIADITQKTITFVNPFSVNQNWARVITQAQKDRLTTQTIRLTGSQDNWIGWYYAGSKDSTGFILNFVAPNGISEGELYKEVAIEVQYEMLENGVPTGVIYSQGKVIKGVPFSRNSIGMTIKQSLPKAGEFRFRVKRVNDDGNGKNLNLINDVTFESAFSYYETTRTAYPLDTIIRLRRMAIGSGTNASELNLIAHRKLETPSGFTTTSNFADIVYSMATDPYIGRMLPNEVDISALRAVSSQIINYFGTPQATEFNYTFDDTNASYQEMVAVVADAVFCTARRENGQHYFVFEKATPNSLILFNHRNMKPNSITVSESFIVEDGHDGVELKWRNAKDNYTEAVIKLPNDLCTNYKTIETQGVTNHVQAWLLANRVWNKLKYGRKAIEFTAYGEADLVTRLDRIAVVDSTIPMLCAGEIEWQENTVLTLDYPLPDTNLSNLSIHLQLKNGVVDVIDIDRIIDNYTVQLKRIPMQPLVTAGVVSTTFAITQAGGRGFDSYLIKEKNANSTFETTINANKYDGRYYQNDSDYLTNSIPT